MSFGVSKTILGHLSLSISDKIVVDWLDYCGRGTECEVALAIRQRPSRSQAS